MADRRAVITGVGPVSSVGVGRDDMFSALREGRTGISEVSLFDASKYRSRTAAEISDFKVEDYLESEKTYLDRNSQLAFAAVALALEDGALDLKTAAPERVALSLGTAYGCLDTMAVFFQGFVEKGPRFVKPFLFPHTYPNTTSSLLAIEYGIRGFHMNFASGCIASACALAYGLDIIRHGRAEIVIAGGTDALGETLFRGCLIQGLLSPLDDGPELCRPFDRKRNGAVLGEGAGIVIVEELGHAVARKAHVYAELAGAGMAGAAGGGNAGGGGRGSHVCRAMARAAEDSGLGPADVDFVSAGAAGNPALDGQEEAGIQEFLSGNSLTSAVVGAIKGAIGETMGAASALQVIAAIHAIENNVVPPVANLENPDSGSALNLVRGRPVERDVEVVLVNATDPGGGAVSLVVRRYEG